MERFGIIHLCGHDLWESDLELTLSTLPERLSYAESIVQYVLYDIVVWDSQ